MNAYQKFQIRRYTLHKFAIKLKKTTQERKIMFRHIYNDILSQIKKLITLILNFIRVTIAIRINKMGNLHNLCIF